VSIVTRQSLDSFIRATSTFCSNLDAFSTTEKPSIRALLEECEELAEHAPSVREAIRNTPTSTKRSFGFLYSLFEMCKRNLDEIEKKPDMQLLRNRLLTNTAQLKRALTSFSTQLP